MKKKKTPTRKIEKLADKDWKEWYAGLDEKEHELKLKQLGLDKDDVEAWEEMRKTGISLDDLEKATSDDFKEPNAKPKKKK